MQKHYPATTDELSSDAKCLAVKDFVLMCCYLTTNYQSLLSKKKSFEENFSSIYRNGLYEEKQHEIEIDDNNNGDV